MDASSGKRKKRRATSDITDDDSDAETIDGEGRDGDENKKSWQKGYTKPNHSEIEKRRRDKMNTYINELSTMIPMCNAMSRKLDKLTVLRMAVQHMKTLKGALDPFTETNYKPAFLSDEDLKNLILEAADGFLFVVGCDRGCLLYASDSIQTYLNQTPSDLVGHSFLDLVHQKDINKVKEQLSSSDTTPRERLIDAKTGLPLKTENQPTPTRLCSGARRSFFCRMKCGSKGKNKDGMDPEPCLMKRKNKTKQAAQPDKKPYVVVHCTGYLKSWPPSGSSFDDDDEDSESRNLSCLVAVGRVETIYDETTDYSQPGIAKEFVSRHGLDGKFIFVDQRATAITGYLPQELIGSSGYEYFHQEDLNSIAVAHRQTLKGETVTSDPPYRFRCKAGHWIPLRTKSTVFRNPWSKELEFLVCINTVVTDLESLALPPIAPNLQTALQLTGRVGSASSVQSGSMGASQSGIQQVLEVLKKRQPTDAGLNSTAKKIGDADSTRTNMGASRIGTMVAEEVQNQETQDKQSQFGMRANTNSRSNEDLSLNMDGSGGVSTINMDDISPNAPGGSKTLSVGGLGSHGGGASVDNQQQLSQAHLLEQLIGMQNAIESMETPMEQSEETMSVFMNMLEADAGLGGDFEGLS
ncbi:hypothetical protein ACROYT_G037359 [Oculina patagonica]